MKILISYLSSTATKLLGSSTTTSNSKCDDHVHNHKIMNNNHELIAKALEDKQESVELDPSELPCLYESDFDIDEDHQQEIKGNGVSEGMDQICTYEEGPWQILVSNSALRKKREPQSFYDVLSFWKSKEKGEAS